MNKITIALSVAALLIVGCGDKPKEDTSTQEQEKVQVTQNIYGASSASQSTHPPAGAVVQTNAPHVAKVLEVAVAAGYTYAKVNEDGVIYWIAAPQTDIKVGETISYIEQMVMKDFTSKALDKKFDYLMFASAIIPPKGTHDHASHAGKPHPTSQEAQPHDCDSHAGKPHPTTKKVEVPAEKISVAKLDDGYSVEEIHASKAQLKDKTIKLRAKVVKVSKGIMGKDWIHLQDGTGEGVTSDIILTTKDSDANVGDIVIAEAVVKTDVDLGYGYFYSLILQDGKFIK